MYICMCVYIHTLISHNTKTPDSWHLLYEGWDILGSISKWLENG